MMSGARELLHALGHPCPKRHEIIGGFVTNHNSVARDSVEEGGGLSLTCFEELANHTRCHMY